MTRRFIDISMHLENDVISDPPGYGPKIHYQAHQETYAQIAPFFPGLTKEDLPDGEGWAVVLNLALLLRKNTRNRGFPKLQLGF